MPTAASGRDSLTAVPAAASYRWVRSGSAMWRYVFDDVMLADGHSQDAPFALAGGSRLWRQLATPHTSSELAALLDTGQAGAAEAIEQLLVDLYGRGIVSRCEL